MAVSSRAATAGPAAFPAASTCRPQPPRQCRAQTLTTLADADAKFAAAGVTRDKNVILYCGGGISATIDLFLLTQLGYDRLTLYDASMGEWARDPALPIETGLGTGSTTPARSLERPLGASPHRPSSSESARVPRECRGYTNWLR
ncbi:rhodanese-like domain-containing protein [Bradyrhizobium betae]